MTCNTGQRKIFADNVVASMTKLAKKHGLEDVVVQRDANPVIVAARGCLRDADGEVSNEKVELLVQVSADLEKADRLSLVSAQVATEPPSDVYRAFDLSDVVAKDSVTRASEPEDEKC